MEPCLRVVDLLLKSGSNGNARDKNNVTPLFSAANCGSCEITQLLLGLFLFIFVVRSIGVLVLCFWRRQAVFNHVAVHGQKENTIAQLCRGRLFSTQPSMKSANVLVIIVADHGARFEQQSRHSLTPFMVSVLKGHLDLCRVFLRLNCRLDGKYPSSKSVLQVQKTSTRVVTLCSSSRRRRDSGALVESVQDRLRRPWCNFLQE